MCDFGLFCSIRGFPGQYVLLHFGHIAVALLSEVAV